MDDLTIAEFLKMKQFALFVVSQDRDDIGHKILRRLTRLGYRAYPVNPRIAKIGSARCYGNLDELPSVPQVIVIALPPDPALEVLKSGVAHGVRRFWIQPGSESDAILTYISENGLTAVVSECLHQWLGKRS